MAHIELSWAGSKTGFAFADVTFVGGTGYKDSPLNIKPADHIDIRVGFMDDDRTHTNYLLGVSIGNDASGKWYDVGYFTDGGGDFVAYAKTSIWKQGISPANASGRLDLSRTMTVPDDSTIKDVWVTARDVLNKDIVLANFKWKAVLSVSGATPPPPPPPPPKPQINHYITLTYADMFGRADAGAIVLGKISDISGAVINVLPLGFKYQTATVDKSANTLTIQVVEEGTPAIPIALIVGAVAIVLIVYGIVLMKYNHRKEQETITERTRIIADQQNDILNNPNLTSEEKQKMLALLNKFWETYTPPPTDGGDIIGKIEKLVPVFIAIALLGAFKDLTKK